MRRRNMDADTRGLERELEESPTPGLARKLAETYRRAGIAGPDLMIEALLSAQAERAGVDLRPGNASYVVELVRFMLSEILVRPLYADPPADLRRDLWAPPVVKNGLSAYADGLGNVSVGSMHRDTQVRTMPDDNRRTGGEDDPRTFRRWSRLVMHSCIHVVHDAERSAVTVGLRFSDVLPRSADQAWVAELLDPYNAAMDAADQAAGEGPGTREVYNALLSSAAQRIYVAWARRPADDRVVIDTAAARAFAVDR